MKRNGKVLLGVGLLGLGAWSVVPGMIHPISTDAVVNAEIVTVRAAAEGRLAAGASGVGERVAAGDALARVQTGGTDALRKDSLETELAVQRNMAAALAAEERQLAELDRSLARRAQNFRTAARRDLELNRVQSEARVKALRSDQRRAETELERKRILAAKDLVAPVAVDAARAAADAAKAAAEAEVAALARVSGEIAAVSRGAAMPGTGYDSPYAEQRRDEIRLKRAARAVEAAQAQVRIAELGRQLAAAPAREAVLTAPVDGVVWQRFAADGDTIRPGDPVVGVVDCDKLFLSAVLPKRYFPELRSGDRARVTLAGQSQVRAVVQSVRAAGGAQANTTAAVTPSAQEGKDVVVTLAVQDASLGNRSDNLCQVGQHATVTFQVPALKPLVNAVALGILRGGNAS